MLATTDRTALDRGGACEQRCEYERARRAYVAAVRIMRQATSAGPECVLEYVDALTRLGRVLRLAGRYRRAEPFLRRALEIVEHARFADEDRAAAIMCDLAMLYKLTARYDEAAALYHRSLAILASREDREPEAMANLFHHLGALEHARGRFALGEPYARMAVAIRERVLGPDHPRVAADMATLAALLDGQGKCSEAEDIFRRARTNLDGPPAARRRS